jgi:TBCC domain-containing protein 1
MLLPRGQVLGAVGRLVRIERCERVQLIAAAARLIVSSCHDCIFYLGVNRAPLLIGDNRFIQARPPLLRHTSSGSLPRAALAGYSPIPSPRDLDTG